MKQKNILDVFRIIIATSFYTDFTRRERRVKIPEKAKTYSYLFVSGAKLANKTLEAFTCRVLAAETIRSF